MKKITNWIKLILWVSGASLFLCIVTAPLYRDMKITMNHRRGSLVPPPGTKEVHEAERAWTSKDYAKADRLFQRSLILKDSWDTQEKYARFLTQTGNFKKSLPIYQKLVNAMAHSRDNLEILLRYAYALDANSRNEEANVIYRRLYSLNPRDLRVSPLLSSGTSHTSPKPNSSL